MSDLIFVHAFMIELDQLEYHIQEKLKLVKIYAQGQWRCFLVVSHILAEFDPDRAAYTTLHNYIVLLNGFSKISLNFTVGFLTLLSTHPIHIVV